MVWCSVRHVAWKATSIPNVDKMAWVYDTEVTIGTQNAQSNATPWIKGSVYGGGENGHNFHDASVTVHSGTIGIAEGAEIIDDRGTPGDTSDDISYSGARFLTVVMYMVLAAVRIPIQELIVRLTSTSMPVSYVVILLC